MRVSHRLFVLAALAAVATAGHARAQCDSGGTIALRINGLLPAVVSPSTHQVPVLPNSTMAISVDGPSPGVPFILVGGVAVSCQSLNTPWGGSIDLQAPFVLLDGLFGVGIFDTFAVTGFTVVLPTIASGLPCPPAAPAAPAFQAVFVDPSAPPFNVDNTQAGQPYFAGVKTTVYAAMIDDSAVLHALDCSDITYAGLQYTQIFIGSNGQLTFTAGSTDFTPTAAEFFHGFRAITAAGANPGVAPLWNDFHRSTVTTDDVTVVENSAQGTVSIRYNNQMWWNSLLPAGSWQAEFGVLGSDSLLFDLSGVTPTNLASDLMLIVGVTDGIASVGTDTQTDLSASHVSPGGVPDSVMEGFINGGLGWDLGVLTILHLGAPGAYEWFIF